MPRDRLCTLCRGFSVEQRLGLSKLTQFWCETTVIGGGGGGEKKEFLKVVNLEVYTYQ